MIIDLRSVRARLALVLVICCIPFFFHHGKQLKEKQVEEPVLVGEFMTWTEVDKLFPRYAKAKIVDVDTGKGFYVQRRGGAYHADIQPLTAEDTAVMKEIYGGKWSWKRRAALLELENGRRIAASINGMPHGRGAIKDNQFNGHSCIHFRASKTHGSRRTDEAHQLMVWKAADMIEQQMRTHNAEEVLSYFFIALKQGDESIARKLLLHPSKKALEPFADIETISVDHIKPLGENWFEVKMRVRFKNADRELLRVQKIRMEKQDGYYHLDEQYLGNIQDDDVHKVMDWFSAIL